MKDHYMPSQYKGVWIRIAGFSKRIKNMDPPPHWRYEIEGTPGQFPLHSWTLRGFAMSNNNSQGTNPNAENEELLAWVRYFGDVTVDDKGHATIHLQSPPDA